MSTKTTTLFFSIGYQGMPPTIIVKVCENLQIKCQKTKVDIKSEKRHLTKLLTYTFMLTFNQLTSYPQEACLGVRLHTPK